MSCSFLHHSFIILNTLPSKELVCHLLFLDQNNFSKPLSFVVCSLINFEILYIWWRHNMDSGGSYHHRSDRLRRAVPGMEHGTVRLDCRPFLDAVFRSHHSHLNVPHVWLLPIHGPRAWPHQEQIIYWSCWSESGSDSCTFFWSLSVLVHT